MQSSVFWYTQKEPEQHPVLNGREKADVVIVGGGMAGLSAALKLATAGKSVIVLERNFCGAGASGKTSGFITPDSEIELGSLISNHGPEKARDIWEFALSGVELIRANITNYKFDCDYQVEDSLFVANNAKGQKQVTKEHHDRIQLGYASTLYDKSSLASILKSSKYAGGVSYSNTFGINSYLYCQALASVLTQAGVRIFEQSNVVGFDKSGVRTKDGKVEADDIIICGDRFIPDLGVLKKEIYHVQTFLGISQQLTDEEVQKIFSRNRAMVWDTDLVYNYFRVTGDNRVLVGGGDLLYTYAKQPAQNVEHFARRLHTYMRNKFPNLEIDFKHVWSGMLGVSKDLLPVIGEDPHFRSIFYVGAATGLPWAAALGTYAAERIISGSRKYDETFSWKRKFVIGPRLQSILSTPVTYAIANGVAKYL